MFIPVYKPHRSNAGAKGVPEIVRWTKSVSQKQIETRKAAMLSRNGQGNSTKGGQWICNNK